MALESIRGISMLLEMLRGALVGSVQIDRPFRFIGSMCQKNATTKTRMVIPGRQNCRRVLLLSTVALLSGCAELRPFVSPAADLPDRYAVISPVGEAAAPVEEWWRGIGDPTLTSLVESAMAQSLSLAQARSRVTQARANLSGVTPLPSGGISVGADRSNGEETTTGAILSATFPTPWDVYLERSSAFARWEAAVLGEADARRLLSEDVASAYIDLRFFQQLLIFRRQDLEARREIERWAERRVELEAATRLDLLNSQAARVEVEADIAATEFNIASQKYQIATLLGVPLRELGGSLDSAGRQPVPRGTPAVGYPADLMRNRPDIRQAERSYAAAVSDLNQATADRFPKLSLGGTLEWVFTGGDRSDSLFARITMPIFDQPQLQAAERGAEAAAEETLLSWRSTVLSALADVETSALGLESARRTAERAREAVRLNEEASAFYIQSMEQGGLATVLDILDQQQTLSRVRSTLAGSLRDVALNYVRLHAALGMPLPEPGTLDPQQTTAQATGQTDG